MFYDIYGIKTEQVSMLQERKKILNVKNGLNRNFGESKCTNQKQFYPTNEDGMTFYRT